MRAIYVFGRRKANYKAMKIINGMGDVKGKYRKPVIAIGVFDGLHRGHQRILQKTIKKARAFKGTSIVITFFPHPVHILRPNVFSPLIVSLSYRLRLIEQAGIDVCVLVHFTKRFSSLEPQDFIEKYLLEKFHPKVIIVGDDFRFGKDRLGTLSYFQKYAARHGVVVSALSTGPRGKKAISSTDIRKLIIQGNLTKASRLLGRPVSILGKVIHGDARGKTLGYPTANILPCREVIPPSGIYFVNVIHKNKRYRGMASVGRRPTFKRISKVNMEVHIFNFKRNIYGQEIIVEFLKKIRDEKVFLSKEALIQQIQKDEKQALNWFSKSKSPSI